MEEFKEQIRTRMEGGIIAYEDTELFTILSMSLIKYPCYTFFTFSYKKIYLLYPACLCYFLSSIFKNLNMPVKIFHQLT